MVENKRITLILDERMKSGGWSLLWVRKGGKNRNSVRFYWIHRGPYLELVGVEVVTSDRLMDIIGTNDVPVYTIQFEDQIETLMRFIKK